jgi:hypothetical protein
MGIHVVLYCCHGDRSGECIPDGDLPIAILNRGRVVQINAVIRGRITARGGDGERQAVINACVARHNSAAQ